MSVTKVVSTTVLLCASGALALLQQPAPPHPPPQAKAPAPPASQQGPAPDDARGRIRVRTELVVVPVTVKDAGGNPVLDLARTDFRILEDGLEQEIEVFSSDPFPLSAVLLIDNSLQQKAAEQVQKSMTAVAGGMSAADEAAIMLFDEQTAQPSEWFTDSDKLYDQLKRTELDGQFSVRAGGPMTSGPRINSQPQAGGVPPSPARSGRNSKRLDDAVFAAAMHLRNAPRDRRKIVFLISDGANSKGNKVSFDEAVRALLSADISVYAIGVGDAHLSRGINALSRYAHSTGGDVFYAGSRGGLEGLYARVTEQARNQYTLAYAPRRSGAARDFHDIEVRVRRRSVTVLARQGYFSPSL
jgi:VWFA-related protein